MPVITHGGGGTPALFVRSNDPIKKIPEVNFDSGQDLTVAEWLEAAFYPFIPAALAFDAVPVQEFGLTTNTKTLEGNLTVWDEDTFTPSSFILRKNTVVQGSAFADPTGDTDWSRTLDVQPDSVNGRTASYTIEVRVGNNTNADFTLSTPRTVTFAAPTFHALGSATLTPAQIQDPANSDKHVVNTRTSSHTYTSPSGKFPHIAIPSDLGSSGGPLVSIKDSNGFEYLNSNNPAVSYVDSNQNLTSAATTQPFTLQNGQTVNYYVYRWNVSMVTNDSFYLSFS